MCYIVHLQKVSRKLTLNEVIIKVIFINIITWFKACLWSIRIRRNMPAWFRPVMWRQYKICNYVKKTHILVDVSTHILLSHIVMNYGLKTIRSQYQIRICFCISDTSDTCHGILTLLEHNSKAHRIFSYH